MATPETLVLTDGEHGLNKEMTASQVGAELAALGVMSSRTAIAYSPPVDGVKIGLGDMINQMAVSTKEIRDNNFKRTETMLVSQMIALDAMFNQLAIKAANAEYMDGMATYTKLALKAQAQARCTAEALAMIKNPQTFIKQTNIAQGHQQVNNMYASASSHTSKVEESSAAGKTETAQSKLLGNENEWLDTRAPSKAVRDDQVVAAVATQHGRKDARRQGKGG
jgi:hypothetical protein